MSRCPWKSEVNLDEDAPTNASEYANMLGPEDGLV
jgi:hypothetical protein